MKCQLYFIFPIIFSSFFCVYRCEYIYIYICIYVYLFIFIHIHLHISHRTSCFMKNACLVHHHYPNNLSLFLMIEVNYDVPSENGHLQLIHEIFHRFSIATLYSLPKACVNTCSNPFRVT